MCSSKIELSVCSLLIYIYINLKKKVRLAVAIPKLLQFESEDLKVIDLNSLSHSYRPELPQP